MKSRGHKTCQTCGKDLWDTEELPIKGCWPHWAKKLTAVERFNGIDLVHIDTPSRHDIYAYAFMARTGSHRHDGDIPVKVSVEHWRRAELKLRNALIVAKLWDESKYGLYAVQEGDC
jgi:hypothetical protein